MLFKPVLLWTDLLLLVLLISVVSFGIYAYRQKHLRNSWRQVFNSKIAMVSGVILLFYVVVGVLDSIHFRKLQEQKDKTTQQYYAVEVLSVLDLTLMHLKQRVEKTYSAPFSIYSFAKETLEKPDGSKSREFPRLIHAGAHLNTPEAHLMDIVTTAASGLVAGVGLWLAVCVTILTLLAVRKKTTLMIQLKSLFTYRDGIPWLYILATVGVMILVFSTAWFLSTKYHIFGTDKVGEDVFYAALKSIRTGLLIGTLTTLVMLPFALLMGTLAGYLGGWVDDAIQYLYTTLNSVPGVLLIVASVLMVQVYINKHPDLFTTDAERADFRLLALCVILGITSWTGLCRLLRGETLKLRQAEYVQAAVAFGVSQSTIIIRHILPNVMHIVLISVVLDFSALVLAEAVLSYIGVGVDPTMDSWGSMINGARLEMAREPMVWWNLAAAFIFMLILVLAANLFSDAVRDAFDPQIRKQ